MLKYFKEIWLYFQEIWKHFQEIWNSFEERQQKIGDTCRSEIGWIIPQSGPNHPRFDSNQGFISPKRLFHPHWQTKGSTNLQKHLDTQCLLLPHRALWFILAPPSEQEFMQCSHKMSEAYPSSQTSLFELELTTP